VVVLKRRVNTEISPYSAAVNDERHCGNLLQGQDEVIVEEDDDDGQKKIT